MAEAPLSLNIEYFSNPVKGVPIFNGSVYVGIPDLDPITEANRVDVVVIQEDGTRVIITKAAQPLTTGAGGQIQYSGENVVVLVDGSYSIRVNDSLGAQMYYAPRANASTPTAREEGVLVLNGSFETETVTGVADNWTQTPTTTGTVLPDNTSSAHGVKSLKFTSVDATGAGIATSDKFFVSENDLDVRFIYKSSNAATLNKVEVKFYNSAGAPISTVTAHSDGATNPTTYTAYLKRVTPPAGAVEAEVILTGMNALGAITNGNTSFDGILVEVSNPVINSVNVDNAVNRIKVSDAITGEAPSISAEGEADTGLIIADSNGNKIVSNESVANAVNSVRQKNAATGSNPSIGSGGEADTGLIFEDSNNNELAIFETVASAVNELTHFNSVTSEDPGFQSTGGDTNIGFNLKTKNAGIPKINGADATPRRVLIETQAASSSATIEFITGIDSTYDQYEVDIINAIPSTNDQQGLVMGFTTNGGSTWTTDNITTFGSVGAISGVVAEGGLSGRFRFYSPSVARTHHVMHSEAVYIRDDATVSLKSDVSNGFVTIASSAINGVKFQMFSSPTSTILSGTFRLYGIK